MYSTSCTVPYHVSCGMCQALCLSHRVSRVMNRGQAMYGILRVVYHVPRIAYCL